MTILTILQAIALLLAIGSTFNMLASGLEEGAVQTFCQSGILLIVATAYRRHIKDGS